MTEGAGRGTSSRASRQAQERLRHHFRLFRKWRAALPTVLIAPLRHGANVAKFIGDGRAVGGGGRRGRPSSRNDEAPLQGGSEASISCASTGMPDARAYYTRHRRD